MTEQGSQQQQQQQPRPPATRSRWRFWIAMTFLFSVCLIDLCSCPYSKVEESFQIQATHDLYYYGIPTTTLTSLWTSQEQQPQVPLPPYDHLQYPGVVPRTFVGPAILTICTRLIVWLHDNTTMIIGSSIFGDGIVVVKWNDDARMVQFIARYVLLLINLFGWYRFATAVDQRTSQSQSQSQKQQQQQQQSKTNYSTSTTSTPTTTTTIGTWLLIITACQFHIPFYSSRMLPNTFALSLVLQCYAYWIYGQVNVAAFVLVVTTTIFRCDLLLLLFSVGICWIFLQKQLTILSAIRIGILSGVGALILTVPFDSLLWQQPQFWIWPEGQVLYFNSVLNKSKEWGVLPWNWYFVNAIPKAMLLTLLLVPLSMTNIVEHLVMTEQRLRRQRQQLQSSQQRSSSQQSSSSQQQLGLQSYFWMVDGTWMEFICPVVIGFVGLYSCLGHKEVRFIFPALPMFNLAAAIGMNKLALAATGTAATTTTTVIDVDVRRRKKNDDYKDDSSKDDISSSPSISQNVEMSSWIGWIGYICGILCMMLTFCGSMLFVAVSRMNYPGGVALQVLTDHLVYNYYNNYVIANNPRFSSSSHPNNGQEPLQQHNIHVYIDNAAAMSGVSLFGQRAAQEASSSYSSQDDDDILLRWTFTKEGYEDEHANIRNKQQQHVPFTHVLSEDPNWFATNDADDDDDNFRIIYEIPGRPRLNLRNIKTFRLNDIIEVEPTIYVIERM